MARSGPFAAGRHRQRHRSPGSQTTPTVSQDLDKGRRSGDRNQG